MSILEKARGKFSPSPIGLKVKEPIEQGIKKGWFRFEFDPIWLEECNGFEKIEM